jgi:transposase
VAHPSPLSDNTLSSNAHLIERAGDAFGVRATLPQWAGRPPPLLGISKRGDAYLRTLLIHGARSVIYASGRKQESTNRWLAELIQRRNSNLAAVALANKTARIAWALLARDRLFQPGYQAVPPLNA